MIIISRSFCLSPSSQRRSLDLSEAGTKAREAVRRENRFKEEIRCSSQNASIDLSSNSFPIFRRDSNFKKLEPDTVFKLARARTEERMAGLSFRELEELLFKSEDRIEVMESIALIESMYEFASPKELMLRGERSPSMPTSSGHTLGNIRGSLLNRCANMPEQDCAPLREWIAEYVLRQTGLPVPEDSDALRRQTIIGGESSMNIHRAVTEATVKSGETVLVPEASFGAFFLTGDFAGASTTVIPTAHSSFRLTLASLAKTIDESSGSARPALLLLTNPSNPSGYSYTATELRKIAELCISKKIILLVDELYSQLDIPGKGRDGVHIGSLTATVKGKTVRLYDHVITCWGNSKLFGISSSKLGFAVCGNEELVAKVNVQLEKQRKLPTIREVALSETLMKAHLPHLRHTAATLKAGYHGFSEALKRTNEEIGECLFTVMHDPHASYFATIGIDIKKAQSVNIYSHLHFAEYLYRVLGIGVDSVESMLVSSQKRYFCRINFVDTSRKELDKAFSLLKSWGIKLRAGSAPKITLDT